jgi:endo-1,3-1,4-beta-glycanase ExoK
MTTDNSRSHSGRSRLRSCLALTALILFFAAGSARAQGGPFFDDLTSPNNLWNISDGWDNGLYFDVGWCGDHLNFMPAGYMRIHLDDVPCPTPGSSKPYTSGEYQSADLYGYGEFSVRMKTATDGDPATIEDGLVTGFFTYTGTALTPDHDEIDIEILGKNPYEMQTNYYVGGVGGHEHPVPLPFDSSAGFHNYGFKWEPGRISWYVDGHRVHHVLASDVDLDGTIEDTDGDGLADEGLPTRPGKIMMNMWAVSVDAEGWANHFTYPGTSIVAKYEWVQYK